jgi:CheY-like chemotaxis protein
VRSQGGLGIGLALAKALVELHGGSIEARSDGPGKGSEFVVRLPLRRVAQDPKPIIPPAPPTRKAKASRRILVVEDNVDGARSLESLLKMLGHEVAVAHDGTAGLDTARTFKPDLAILDIGLPGGISGYEVARRLRQTPEHKDVMLIAMTGWGKEEDRKKAMEAGFNAHLVKPVELQDLQVLLSHTMT